MEKQNPTTGKWDKKYSEKLNSTRKIEKGVVDDVTSVLKDYPAAVNHRLEDGRKAASKTGTWELKGDSKDNGDAWMVGYTPQLATAVWVGNVNARKPLLLKDDRKVSGGNLPGDIWERFMDEALKGKPKLDFRRRRTSVTRTPETVRRRRPAAAARGPGQPEPTL
ncbi:penicillin-binding transpeptidase domain-containing protein [Micromonospora sp. M12]